jgi:LysM repeat protein
VQEVPFRTTFDFALPEDCWSTLTIEDTEAIQITGERVELKCNVRLHAQVYETTAYTVALEAELLEEGHDIPGGITLYFVQPGDTLWSVAKRFRTTRESLTRFNPEVDELTGNEKLLLYKRKVNV